MTSGQVHWIQRSYGAGIAALNVHWRPQRAAQMPSDTCSGPPRRSDWPEIGPKTDLEAESAAKSERKTADQSRFFGRADRI